MSPSAFALLQPPQPMNFSLTSASSTVMQTVNTDLLATWWRHSHQSSQRWWVCRDSLGKLGGPNKEKFKWCESHLQIYLLQLRSLDKKRRKIIYMMKQIMKGYPLGSEHTQKKNKWPNSTALGGGRELLLESQVVMPAHPTQQINKKQALMRIPCSSREKALGGKVLA